MSNVTFMAASMPACWLTGKMAGVRLEASTTRGRDIRPRRASHRHLTVTRGFDALVRPIPGARTGCACACRVLGHSGGTVPCTINRPNAERERCPAECRPSVPDALAAGDPDAGADRDCHPSRADRRPRRLPPPLRPCRRERTTRSLGAKRSSARAPAEPPERDARRRGRRPGSCLGLRLVPGPADDPRGVGAVLSVRLGRRRRQGWGTVARARRR